VRRGIEREDEMIKKRKRRRRTQGNDIPTKISIKYVLYALVLYTNIYLHQYNKRTVVYKRGFTIPKYVWREKKIFFRGRKIENGPHLLKCYFYS